MFQLECPLGAGATEGVSLPGGDSTAAFETDGVEDPFGSETATDGGTGGSASEGAPDAGTTDGDVDVDVDGIPDHDDNCPGFANPTQADGDADGLGDRCDLDTACGAGMAYEPLLADAAVVTSGVEGLCVGCEVRDEDFTIDHDFTTHTRIQMTAGLGSAYVEVTDDTTVFPAGTRVGFVVGRSEWLELSDPSSLMLTTTLRGQPQQSESTLGDFMVLDGIDRVLVMMETTEDYDGIRVDYGGIADVGDGLDVYAACVESP